MIAGGYESTRNERKRRKRVCEEANIMVVEALSQHPIIFELETNNKVSTPHSDPLVISVKMNKFMVKRILIDIGNFISLLTLDVFGKLELHQKKNLSRVSYPLLELSDKSVPVISVTNLTMVVGEEKCKRDICVEFRVVDIPLSYNFIFGWSIFNNYGMIINENVSAKIQ